MTRRFSFVAALALVASFATGAQAQSINTSIGSFSQLVPGISATYSGSSSLPSVLTIGVTGTYNVLAPQFLINPLGPTQYNNASFNLTATSSSVPNSMGPQNSVQGGFSGTFSIVDGMTTILTGTFSGAQLAVGLNSAFFTVAPNGVNFTGGIYVPQLINDQFNLAILSLDPQNPASPGGIQGFRSTTVAGNFAAVIPEPATLAMAGLGIFALPLAVRATRRRRSLSSN